jgi:hypothetical protein
MGYSSLQLLKPSFKHLIRIKIIWVRIGQQWDKFNDEVNHIQNTNESNSARLIHFFELINKIIEQPTLVSSYSSSYRNSISA